MSPWTSMQQVSYPPSTVSLLPLSLCVTFIYSPSKAAPPRSQYDGANSATAAGFKVTTCAWQYAHDFSPSSSWRRLCLMTRKQPALGGPRLKGSGINRDFADEDGSPAALTTMPRCDLPSYSSTRVRFQLACLAF